MTKNPIIRHITTEKKTKLVAHLLGKDKILPQSRCGNLMTVHVLFYSHDFFFFFDVIYSHDLFTSHVTYLILLMSYEIKIHQFGH